MFKGLRHGLALAGAAVLLLQSPFAGASGSACVKACEGMNAPAPVQTCCDGKEQKKSKPAPAKKCDSSCKSVCVAKRTDAPPQVVAAGSVVLLAHAAVMPTPLVFEFSPIDSEPKLFETDSGPPVLREVTACGLRAPPVLGA